jgi:hypothetical protein
MVPFFVWLFFAGIKKEGDFRQKMGILSPKRTDFEHK